MQRANVLNLKLLKDNVSPFLYLSKSSPLRAADSLFKFMREGGNEVQDEKL